VAHNLPAAPTSFAGRRRELAELEALLGRTPMLTLTGPGGAGKTRLAVELARSRAGTDRYSEGVWFIGLADLPDGSLVAWAVAAELGFALPAGRPAVRALAGQLAGRRVLLLVDNCEHLVGSCAELLAALIAGCPGLVITATSREALRIPGEVWWRVSSLELPRPGTSCGCRRKSSDGTRGAVRLSRADKPVPGPCRSLGRRVLVQHGNGGGYPGALGMW
jgi:predicted ATPase